MQWNVYLMDYSIYNKMIDKRLIRNMSNYFNYFKNSLITRFHL